jgi:hypothetical protein
VEGIEVPAPGYEAKRQGGYPGPQAAWAPSLYGGGRPRGSIPGTLPMPGHCPGGSKAGAWNWDVRGTENLTGAQTWRTPPPAPTLADVEVPAAAAAAAAAEVAAATEDDKTAAAAAAAVAASTAACTAPVSPSAEWWPAASKLPPGFPMAAAGSASGAGARGGREARYAARTSSSDDEDDDESRSSEADDSDEPSLESPSKKADNRGTASFADSEPLPSASTPSKGSPPPCRRRLCCRCVPCLCSGFDWESLDQALGSWTDSASGTTGEGSGAPSLLRTWIPLEFLLLFCCFRFALLSAVPDLRSPDTTSCLWFLPRERSRARRAASSSRCLQATRGRQWKEQPEGCSAAAHSNLWRKQDCTE